MCKHRSPIISSPTKDCNCRKCIDGKVDKGTGLPLAMMRFIVCDICGNKRCPHATDCALDCTGSNEPGQEGSVF